jgi:lysophospholipase L1-like esterase
MEAMMTLSGLLKKHFRKPGIWAVKQCNLSKLAIVSLVFLGGTFACEKKESAPIQNTPPVPVLPNPNPMPLRVLALGDSYTIGQGVARDDRFPHQTVARLKQMGRNFMEPDYIAQTGWTTLNLLHAIARENKPKNYDVVTLLIGVNNQFQGRDTAEYRSQFTQCLQQAIAHAANRPNRVWVVSIPDYGVTPFGRNLNPEKIAREIDIFNSINQSVSQAFRVGYIEITKGSREALNNPTLIAADNLHPSALEYQKWAEKLTPEILLRLR